MDAIDEEEKASAPANATIKQRPWKLSLPHHKASQRKNDSEDIYAVAYPSSITLKLKLRFSNPELDRSAFFLHRLSAQARPTQVPGQYSRTWNAGQVLSVRRIRPSPSSI